MSSDVRHRGWSSGRPAYGSPRRSMSSTPRKNGRSRQSAGRSEGCPCGSGNRYRVCCGPGATAKPAMPVLSSWAPSAPTGYVHCKSGGGLHVQLVHPLKGHVRNGRLVLDEPIELPDGEVVELVPFNEALARGGDLESSLPTSMDRGAAIAKGRAANGPAMPQDLASVLRIARSHVEA